VFGTVHAPLIHPLIAAKQFVTADHIGQGRFGLNIVCGWNEGEFDMFGATMRQHEARYEYAQEWFDTIRLAWSDAEDFDFHGKFIQVRQARAKPKPYGGSRPIVMNAGASPTGQAFAIRNCDALFSMTPKGQLQEFAAHVASRDRREVLADVLLLTLSLSAIGYVALRPAGATVAAGISAATFAILAATIVAIFGTLALWVPTRGHLLVSLGFVLLALATARFGAAWRPHERPRADLERPCSRRDPRCSRASTSGCHMSISAAHRGLDTSRSPGAHQRGSPTACAALSYVAVLDDARGIAGVHSTALLLLLGLAIAARVLTNQFSSREASVQAQDALERQESALRQPTPLSIASRRRTSRSPLRGTPAARLRRRGRRVRGARRSSAGAPRERRVRAHGVARCARARRHVVDRARRGDRRADPAFARLVTGGPATINRSDGQTLHLESTGLRDPHRSPADPRPGPRCQRGEGGRSDDPSLFQFCRTATKTARACSGGRTRRSNRSATGSPVTSTTGPCRACPPRRCPSRRRCS
jgi:hypothetical protein